MHTEEEAKKKWCGILTVVDYHRSMFTKESPFNFGTQYTDREKKYGVSSQGTDGWGNSFIHYDMKRFFLADYGQEFGFRFRRKHYLIKIPTIIKILSRLTR